ncbi:hypothetical protein GCM10020358_57520 [Amorphoplanes nipponensis]
MDQVAEAAGVSRATVSRVINGAPSVDAKIREIVQRAIADTGYVPNVAARSLVTRKSNSVALVISEPDRPYDTSSSTGSSPTRTSAGSPPAPPARCARTTSTW